MIFQDRYHAGTLLGEKLLVYTNDHPIITAIPRGGISVGYPISIMLHTPMIAYIVRKIGSPIQRELGIGAIGENGVEVYDAERIKELSLRDDDIRKIRDKEAWELQRRVTLYRNGKPFPNIEHNTVILVDDGIATGITIQAAIQGVQKLNPKNIIVAAPVCSQYAYDLLSPLVSQIVCIQTPATLEAIGKWYIDFHQMTDEEVISLL